ncbi:hypothetical protein BBJ28_00021517 [Nothophytophthora sp. Chile5]|nr:hypothetical protein BBJ28_00021517 [Nothophytophthora sp. Chile5]
MADRKPSNAEPALAAKETSSKPPAPKRAKITAPPEGCQGDRAPSRVELDPEEELLRALEADVEKEEVKSKKKAQDEADEDYDESDDED